MWHGTNWLLGREDELRKGSPIWLHTASPSPHHDCFSPSAHSCPPFLRELREDDELGQFLPLPGQAVVGGGEDTCSGSFKERMLRIRACLKTQRMVFSSWPPPRFLDSASFEDSSRVALMAKCPLLPLSAFGRHLESTMTLLFSMCFSLYFADVHFVEIKKRSCFCCFPLKEG